MTTSAPQSGIPTLDLSKTAIRTSLGEMDQLLDQGPAHISDRPFFEKLGEQLRNLHARIRIHHAAGCIDPNLDTERASVPELVGEINRLRDEHSTMLGHLDRLVRCVDSMPDRPAEDADVFFLRTRELVAMLRRHEAEEDRLVYLAVWRDTGGESG